MPIVVRAVTLTFEFEEKCGRPIEIPSQDSEFLHGIEMHVLAEDQNDVAKMENGLIDEGQVDVDDPFVNKTYRAGVYHLTSFDHTDNKNRFTGRTYDFKLIQLGFWANDS